MKRECDKTIQIIIFKPINFFKKNSSFLITEFQTTLKTLPHTNIFSTYDYNYNPSSFPANDVCLKRIYIKNFPLICREKIKR